MRVFIAAALLALAAPAFGDGPPAPTPVPSATPTPTPAPAPTPIASPSDDIVPLYVKGQVLTIASGYFIFTSGDSVRMLPGIVVPAGVMTGSYVRVTIDQLQRAITAIELEPKIVLAGEIGASDIPRQYVVVSPKSAPLPVPSGQTGGGVGGSVSVSIVVHVPGNTPATDPVYLSTERSSYNPSEIPMQRVDATTFSVTVSLPAGTALRYEFTRGTYTTVERDRTGGIVSPRVINSAPNAKSDDTVARWADLS